MSEQGWVYFATSASPACVKIGWSYDPVARLRRLQAASPAPLTLWGVIPGTRQDEKILHECFADYRSHGEWFRVAPGLKAALLAVVGLAANGRGGEFCKDGVCTVAPSREPRRREPEAHSSPIDALFGSGWLESHADRLREMTPEQRATYWQDARAASDEAEQAMRKAECGETWDETQARLAQEAGA